jgi:hypothetical protein
MLKILSIEYHINSPDVKNIYFDDRQTLLDADIIVINPSFLSRFWVTDCVTWDDGRKRLYSRKGSDKVKSIFDWRSQEFKSLLNAGKVVFAFMSPLDTILGEVRDTQEYRPITNYDWLPFEKNLLIKLITSGSGNEIILRNASHPFAAYYKAFKDNIHYDAYLDTEDTDSDTFLVNKAGKAVGYSLEFGKGMLIFAPYLTKKIESNKFVGVLIQCAKHILTKEPKTIEPEWAKDFKIPGEEKYFEDIEKVSEKIEALYNEKRTLESKRITLAEFRALLYEQGKPLEDAVIRALKLMGFHAERFRKADIDHDVILESSEGRAIAEIEGKDNDSIHVDKIDQLTRVIDEDFYEHEVYSDGILIGNPYRFTHPNDRKEEFTEKVRIAAKRKGFILLTSAELFKAVMKILEEPDSKDFKTACRIKILESKGEQVNFF